MISRLRVVGLALAIVGILFMGVGAFTYAKTQEGAAALQAYSKAENVNLTYNKDGQLADKAGSTEEATAIMAMLVNDWKFPVVASDFNPNDTLVNTGSEYMYQMATMTYHTLHATVTVTLPKDVTAADGTVTTAGDHEFVNDGRYWTGFNRANPIEAAAREQVWTGTAHGLIANLGVGTVTASALQMGLGIAGLAAGFGGVLILLGIGLIWVSRAKRQEA
jgi:hypothetical protein